MARELGISLRTLYRDIATLQEQGADIEGETGVGYVLRPGFVIPPLMFPPAEIEALVLGARWVIEHGDEHLALAARDALARISDILPRELRDELESTPLLIGPSSSRLDAHFDLVRQAIRAEQKMRIFYRDSEERDSQRTIWPFALAFFDQVRVIVAWCEMREGFRHFRSDRIGGIELLDEHYPKPRYALLHQWQEAEGIPRQ